MEHVTEYLDDLFSFIRRSPTAYHATASAADHLAQHGFQRLDEAVSWCGLPPGPYYVVRNDASLIAFTLSSEPQAGLPMRMAGAHTDSPGLKIKPNPIQMHHGYIQLGVEMYGGLLLAPWFDRNLSIAGRVTWACGTAPVRCSLIDFKRAAAVIPSLAIHLDREANEKRHIDKQTDLVPVIMLTDGASPPDFNEIIRKELASQYPEAATATILASDLFLYDLQPPCRAGLNSELVTAPRLDNLLSCHALLRAMTASADNRNRLIVLNNHEEIGSLSMAGAQGPFLRSVLQRLYPDPDLLQRVIARSLFISVDNAHAVHPNFAAKHDPDHPVGLNQGPVIKFNAAQRYATDAITAGLFRQLCTMADIPCQEFVMRNDMISGSTIGPLTAAEIGVPTVDVGAPQLAMHSIRETIGHLDGWYLLKVMTTFFGAEDSHIHCPEPGL
ncbi:MAG: M18 family aminopeptidase [Desulfobulbus sp.]|nr:M18 family aminopeptidase [Desulfobulbus sp.]